MSLKDSFLELQSLTKYNRFALKLFKYSRLWNTLQDKNHCLRKERARGKNYLPFDNMVRKAAVWGIVNSPTSGIYTIYNEELIPRISLFSAENLLQHCLINSWKLKSFSILGQSVLTIITRKISVMQQTVPNLVF